MLDSASRSTCKNKPLVQALFSPAKATQGTTQVHIFAQIVARCSFLSRAQRLQTALHPSRPLWSHFCFPSNQQSLSSRTRSVCSFSCRPTYLSSIIHGSTPVCGRALFNLRSLTASTITLSLYHPPGRPTGPPLLFPSVSRIAFCLASRLTFLT
jgi:hypothetical protein